MPSHTDEILDCAARLHSMADAPAEVRSVGDAGQIVSGQDISRQDFESIMIGGPTQAGVPINERSALTVPAVFTAIRIISEAIGQLPLVVYQGDDEDRSRVPAPTHPAYALLRKSPNPDMTAAAFKEAVTGHMVGWGNGYCRIISNNAGVPVALYPLDPARTQPERVAGQLRYTVGTEQFAPEEILHIPAFGFNGIQGYSAIHLQREMIAAAKAQDIFSSSFWRNGGVVDGVLSIPGKVTPETRQRVREGWREMHSGASNAHKVAVLEGGTTYTRIGIPPDEAQFLETRQWSVNQVAMIYRIPLHMMNDLSRATHSNIEQSSLEFLTLTLAPWMVKWEQECTRKLCGINSGYFCRFDERALVRADMDARQKFNTGMRNIGVLSANDIRREEGYPPIEGGDKFWEPVNMRDASQVDAPDDPATGVGAAVRSLFEDAIGRMQRKEAKAIENGKADDAFYALHAHHIREALQPASELLYRLAHVPETPDHRLAASQVIEHAATERRSTTSSDDTAQAASQIIRQLMEVTKGLRR